MDPTLARRMWTALEPIHAMVYFAPEALAAWKELGFDHPRMGYFASRSAAMGAVEPGVVAATFYNFNPATVARFVPAVWEVATPTEVLSVRYRVAGESLERIIGTDIDSPEMSWAADTALQALEACSPAGRPLFAAHAAVPVPERPLLRLWHAATLWREFRGDGHVHALLEAGLSGLEAVVSYTATGDLFDRQFFQRSRGWSDEDWATAEESLRHKGWMDAEGNLTEAGRAGRQSIEDRTDLLSGVPWDAIGEETALRLAGTVRPWTRRVLDADVLGGGGRNVRVYRETN